MAKKIGTRTIIVSRQEEADVLDPEPPPPVEHEINGCAIVPQSTYEEERGWVGIDGYMVAMPYGSDIKGTDQVRLLDIPNVDPATLWDISGSALHYEKKNGRPKATIANLNRVG